MSEELDLDLGCGGVVNLRAGRHSLAGEGTQGEIPVWGYISSCSSSVSKADNCLSGSTGDRGPCGGGDLSCPDSMITAWLSRGAGHVGEGGWLGGGGSELVVHRVLLLCVADSLLRFSA